MRYRLPLLTLGAILLLELPWLRPHPFDRSDLLFNWYAGRLILEGRSPYDAQAWSDGADRYAPLLGRLGDLGLVTWPYPPWTAYLFAPFAAFDPLVLHLTFVAAAVVAVVALARLFPWRRPLDESAALVLLALSQPLVHAMRFGQFSSFLLLGTALVLAGVRSRATLPLVAGALLLATKPHLVVVFAPLVAVLLIKARAWRPLAFTAGALLLVAGATLARHPEWLGVVGVAAAERAAHLTWFSSTWSLAIALAPQAWLPLGLALVAAAATAWLAAVRLASGELRFWMLVGGALAVSLALTPNAYSYDHVLLAPAVCAAVYAARGPRRTPLLAAAVAIALVVPWLLFAYANEIAAAPPSALVPLLFPPLLLASAGVAARAERAPSLRPSLATGGG